MQILVVGSETHVCNATECIIAVQGHFRVNQGRWFWYQSIARIWFPISDQQQPWHISCTVSKIRRFIGWEIASSYPPQSQKSPSLGLTPIKSNFVMNQIFLETIMFRLSDGEEIMTLAFFVLIQYRSVMDGRTDGHSSSGYTSGLHSSLC